MIASGKALKMWSDYLTYLSLNNFKKNLNDFNDIFYNQKFSFQKTRAIVCVRTEFFGVFCPI